MSQEIYRIRVKGLLDPGRARCFDGLTLAHAASETILSGPIVDQAALYGVLLKIRDLGLPLLEVTCSDLSRDDEPDEAEIR